MNDNLPPLPPNVMNVLRRIRACEGEVPAQVVLEHAMQAYARAAIEANKQAVPDCRVVDRGFRWDADRQEHVPTLVTEFDAVPLNSPYDAKGWTDRDALAAMLAAAPQPQPVAQPDGMRPLDVLTSIWNAMQNSADGDDLLNKLEHMRDSIERAVQGDQQQALQELADDAQKVYGGYTAQEDHPEQDIRVAATDELVNWFMYAVIEAGFLPSEPDYETDLSAARSVLERLHRRFPALPPQPVAQPVQTGWTKALEIRTEQGWDLKGTAVPVLYTDSINGEQVCRDDVWLCTTAALEKTQPVQEQPSEAEKLMGAAGLCRRCAAPLHEQLPPDYMLAKLQMVMPLFQEARDVMPAISVVAMKLHGISPTLADRMDAAGTFSLADWEIAQPKPTNQQKE